MKPYPLTRMSPSTFATVLSWQWLGTSLSAFYAVSLCGISAFIMSAIVLGCVGYDVCANCLENVRWQNGHSREVSTLIDDTITSIAVEQGF